MVLSVFKKGCKRFMMPYFSQWKMTILPVLQKGYKIDFIQVTENCDMTCLIDLSYALHPQSFINTIEFECGDPTIILNEFLISKRKFLVNISGGKINTKSTIAFKIITDTGLEQIFTVLLDVIGQNKTVYNQRHGLRKPELWVINSDPDQHYKQEFGLSWIEGDLLLNLKTHNLWQYDPKINSKWFKIFTMQGVVKPISIEYNLFDKSYLSQIEKSSSPDIKRNLFCNENIDVKSIHTDAFISGNPIGKGISVVTEGMIAGQSLYIGTARIKPKNIYLGCNGVVSTKHLSADFLQLAFFSIKELPNYVPIGTLILCHDYPGYSSPVLLCSIKDKPKNSGEWNIVNDKVLVKNNISGKPDLTVVSSNLSLLDDDKIVEIRPSVTNNSNRIVKPVPSEKSFSANNHHYIRLSFKDLIIPHSKKIENSWTKLKLDKISLVQNISDEWQSKNELWRIPATGLLQINGSFIFKEENMDLSGPISFHGGDQLILKIVKTDKTVRFQPVNQIEFPLIPYINDVMNTICASPKLTFSNAIPVTKGDQISFETVYLHQPDTLKNNLDLKISKAVFEIYIL